MLLEKIEQVVRLIRSKGVGIYFVTQNPMDIPETVLAQLGNRVQHALRAFTPAEQKNIKAAAQSFRVNPAFDTEKVLTELAVGEALCSTLDPQGKPTNVERALVVPPKSQIGAIPSDVRQSLIQKSLLFGHYEKVIDRESAYEKLSARVQAAPTTEQATTRLPSSGKPQPSSGDFVSKEMQGALSAMAKSAARAVGTQVGRQIIRGVLGSLLGGSSRRR